ncbi:MAG: ECF transporter S component [Clostridia bacterium]|nr:ECF transporter S component [Clostridia bacterium]
MTVKEQHEKIVRLVFLAFLIAIVVVLQLFASAIPLGQTQFSLVLIPIALGAMILGPMAGGILGFVFGFIVLMAGITGTDFFTATLFQNAPFITSLLCLGKSTLAGVATGWVYKLLQGKNPFVATVCAAATTPIVNTGLFAFGSLFLKKVLEANFQPEGTSFLYFLFIIIIGINFLVEFGVNLVFSPALVRVVEVIKKQFSK